MTSSDRFELQPERVWLLSSVMLGQDMTSSAWANEDTGSDSMGAGSCTVHVESWELTLVRIMYIMSNQIF